ncbi:MAG: SDR family NAD(P)-dependent oxidoreductase [Candidatus Omnitrophica bacterium]|nr:SDR family NAD(P)-dependent oxidoreductase [Candidatus Omnitrophota bacterium]
MNLEDKVVLVTGSSRGIGRAIALRLAVEGADIIINASKSDREAEEVLSQLPADKGQRHRYIRADIRSSAQVCEMMGQIEAQYGRLDILVNNAGSTHFIEHHKVDELTEDIFDEMYELHLRGYFLCIQKALPLLRKSKEASIVNIASIAAITAVGSNIAYCAMKAGIVNMTKSLARALAPDIRVNAISPGLTETALIKDWKDYKAEQIKRTPLGRLGACEDTANAVFSLVGPLTYVTGQNIVVDGGRTLE